MKVKVILLTKSFHEDELRCWLNWHLNVIGFDHVNLYDNESPIDVQKICSEFDNRVTYNYVRAWPNQKSIYTRDIENDNDDYQWSITLDDDEYLYISDKYNGNIHSLIESIQNSHKNNMYYIMWLNMFSKEEIKSWEKPYIYTHTYYSYKACHALYSLWIQGNNFGKALIDLNYKYSYELGDRGHIPLCLNGPNQCTTINGITVPSANLVNEMIRSKDEENCAYGFNPDCFIAHYQYKNLSDWKLKCKLQRPGCLFSNIRNKSYIYNRVYNYSDSFKECNLLKDRMERFYDSE